MAVSIERPRKTLSDNSRNACGLDRLRSDSASRRTTEVPPRHQDVSLLHLLGKFRIEGLEDVLRHLGETFPNDVRGSDLVCGDVVPKLPAVSFKYHGGDFTSPVNYRFSVAAVYDRRCS